ncbi:DUF418 domain-containing protein [Erythrobacter dokdonensis]|uniref:Putative membrane protein n=1 Tax=Erythrobacter dokdonensis DSW-74 TaxID=1300349 RepID=A0A1A7BDI7_9SPHN|nr:DUF418 domain-containing protein [Erythrobacter dokdonensis]OBV10554.1 putative membrane protein [Erythrobacter dokdonensis DSW-74]
MSGASSAQVRPERIEFVDALRGFALFGLLMVHAAEAFSVGLSRGTDDPWGQAIFFLFGSKAFAIFALLFGFSFATIMGNQRGRGVDFTGRFAWRLLLLMAIGFIHSLLYASEILRLLAFLGLLLIPLDRVRSNYALLAISGLFFLQIPLLVQWMLANWGNAFAASEPYFASSYLWDTLRNGSLGEIIKANATEGNLVKWSINWSFGRVSEIAGLFAIGVIFQRTGFFARIAKDRGIALALLVIGGAIFAILEFIVKPMVPGSPTGPEFAIGPFTERAILFQWIGISAIAAQIGLLALLWNSPAQRLVGLFRGPGRMTLTLYVAHSFVAVPVLYQFGLGMAQVWDTQTRILLAIAFFGLQILFAHWWYARYRYGPLEWTWRAATLNDWKVPLRKNVQPA